MRLLRWITFLVIAASPDVAPAQIVVSGRILDAAEDKPMAGIEVGLRTKWTEASEPAQVAESDKKGRYRFEGVDADSVIVEARYVQIVGKSKLVFTLPTRVVAIDDGSCVIDFHFAPLTENNPAYAYVSGRQPDELTARDVLRLGNGWLARSRASNEQGMSISGMGGYFAIESR